MRYYQVRSIFSPRRQPVWAFVCRTRGRHIFMEKSSMRMRPWKSRPASSYQPKFRRFSPVRLSCGHGMKKRPRRPQPSAIYMKRLKNVSTPSQQAMLIPMPDYRPKYPKINPEVEINPNHPNLTIWHNKIDTCMFVGVHCHQANLSLKIIRGGTYCYTIAMCAQAGHEDAMVSFRDATADKIMKLADWVKKLKRVGRTAEGLRSGWPWFNSFISPA